MAEKFNPEGKVFLKNVFGHSIWLETASGMFIVKYQRDADFDSANYDEGDADNDETLTRRYKTMDEARAFIDNRYDSAQRAKRKPVNLPCNTERGPVKVKSVHGGTGNVVFDVPALAKKEWEPFSRGYGGDTALYPAHPFIDAHLTKLQALIRQQADIKQAMFEHRRAIDACVLHWGSRSSASDETFRAAYEKAVAKADELAG